MESTRKRTLYLIILMLVATALMAGLVASSSRTLTNVALNKPAAQSSLIGPTRTPDKAVDGNHNTNIMSCQQTAWDGVDDPTHWWLVDLQGFYNISSVQITNRGDCCGYRLRDFDIQAFMLNPMIITTAKAHLCYHYDGPMGTGATELLPCSQPTTGRYVRIVITNVGDPLQICEVEVKAKTMASTGRKYVRTKGHNAAGDMLREVTSRSVMQCLVWCSSDVSCNAVNMGPKTLTSAGWSAVCQLLSFGGIGQPASTAPDPDWNFYGIGDM